MMGDLSYALNVKVNKHEQAWALRTSNDPEIYVSQNQNTI